MKTGNIDIHSGEIFKVRVSHKPLKIFYIIIGFFLLLALIGPMAIGQEAYVPAAITGGFSLLMLLLIYSQASGRNTIYRVNYDGIYLKRFWFKDLLSFDEIEFVQKVNEEEAEKIAFTTDAKRVNASNNLDVTNAFKSQLTFGRLTQYSTVPFVSHSTRSSYIIRSHSIDTAGEFIYIRGKGEKHFLISPLETENYLKALVSKSKGKMNFEKGNSSKVLPLEI